MMEYWVTSGAEQSEAPASTDNKIIIYTDGPLKGTRLVITSAEKI